MTSYGRCCDIIWIDIQV